MKRLSFHSVILFGSNLLLLLGRPTLWQPRSASLGKGKEGKGETRGRTKEHRNLSSDCLRSRGSRSYSDTIDLSTNGWEEKRKERELTDLSNNLRAT